MLRYDLILVTSIMSFRSQICSSQRIPLRSCSLVSRMMARPTPSTCVTAVGKELLQLPQSQNVRVDDGEGGRREKEQEPKNQRGQRGGGRRRGRRGGRHVGKSTTEKLDKEFLSKGGDLPVAAGEKEKHRGGGRGTELAGRRRRPRERASNMDDNCVCSR